MNIQTTKDFKTALRNGPYAWPGGYPCYFVMSDGEPMSFKAAQENARLILRALRDKSTDGWRPVAYEVNWESEIWCCHTGERIEPAYETE